MTLTDWRLAFLEASSSICVKVVVELQIWILEKFKRLYLQKYSELQPRIWHAFIILTKVILGIFWAILETDTWKQLVELTRNDPPAIFQTT